VGVPAESGVTVILEPVAERIEEIKSRAERLDLEPKAETVEEISERLAESWRICREVGRLASVLNRGMLRLWREKLPTP
jgi:hypothetical protein